MYKRILLPIDLDQASSWEGALPHALHLASASAASLHVMTVVPDFGASVVSQYFREGYESDMRRTCMDALHRWVRTHIPAGTAVQHIVAEGTIYEQILAIARKIGADLIVLAAHRPELRDYLLGPNAARVVRHADCSVLVVRLPGSVASAS